MENPATERSDYEKAKRNAKAFYSQIGHIWCPTICDEVAFGRAGFQHLIRKGKIQRPKNEQMRRFSLLMYAESIISDRDAEVAYKTKDLGNATAKFWIFKRKLGKVSITLVVRRIGNGNAHFFSIY